MDLNPPSLMYSGVPGKPNTRSLLPAMNSAGVCTFTFVHAAFSSHDLEINAANIITRGTLRALLNYKPSCTSNTRDELTAVYETGLFQVMFKNSCICILRVSYIFVGSNRKPNLLVLGNVHHAITSTPNLLRVILLTLQMEQSTMKYHAHLTVVYLHSLLLTIYGFVT